MNLPETIKAVLHTTAKWPDAKAKYIEDKANGPAVIQMLEKKIPGLIPVNSEGGKEARVNAVAPLMEAGNVYLPHPSIAPWVDDFIEEFFNSTVGDEVERLLKEKVRTYSAQDPISPTCLWLSESPIVKPATSEPKEETKLAEQY